MDSISSPNKNPSVESLSDFLWQYYIEYHPVTDTQVKHNELALEPFFRDLSMEASDDLFGLISDLCVSYQRAAFLDGVRLGIRLLQELQ